METKTIITKSEEETRQFAKDLAKHISIPAVITLTGDLGAGKTTFVQGLAASLGIKQRIISPTFIVIREYDLQSYHKVAVQDEVLKLKKNLKIFYHIDLYRIKHEDDILSLGLFDIMNEKDSIVTIEWPENMGKYLPEKRIDVRFTYIGENERRISITNYK